MRRSLMKRSRIKAPKLTEKRVRQRDRRKEWAASVKARDRMCMNRGPLRLGCGAKTTDAHHVLARSQGGGDDLSNGLGLCHACHMWVHDHRGEAQVLGLLANVGDFSWVPGLEPVGASDREAR